MSLQPINLATNALILLGNVLCLASSEMTLNNTDMYNEMTPYLNYCPPTVD